MSPEAVSFRAHHPGDALLATAPAHRPLIARTPEGASLAGLPPSALTVLDALERLGALTHRDLLAKTPLPGRTVRYALSRLLEAGVVEARPSLRDARQSYYVLARERAAAAPREAARPAAQAA